MSKQFKIHIPISKIDEEQRMVYGIATTEAVDSQNDIVDYEASKKAFPQWLGNIREMHQPIAVGKAIDIQFDDTDKTVTVGAKISESTDGENAWIKVKEGILQGFSIGGAVNKVTKDVAKNKDGEDISVTRIVDYDLAEVSLVDNPANPEAMLVMVKSQKGGLQRVEEEVEGKEVAKQFNLPAWHLQFMLPIEKAQALYDKSMKKGAKAEMKKGLYSAAMLLDLACDLSWYIEGKQYEGVEEGLDELKTALATIKQAIISELSEPTEELTMAVELAQKTISLKKGKAMSKEDVKKSAEEVDEAAQAAEDSAPEAEAAEVKEPKADEAEAAADADESEAGEASEEEAGEESGEDEEAGAEADESEESEEGEAEGESSEADEESDESEDSEKAVTVGDLKKFTKGLIAKLGDSNKAELTKVLGELTDKVEKAVSTLEGRVKKLEDQPAASKAKASYVEIEKGKEGAGEEADVQALLKRQAELIANPNEGTPAERIELAQQLRKAQAAGAKLA